MSDRFSRVKAIVLELIHLPPAERLSHLDHACGDDDALRQEVLSLMAHDDTPSDFLPPVPEPGPAIDVDSELPVIPGYDVRRRIGTGGMGIVFEAEQHEPRRRVAIKVLRSGVSDDEHRRKLFRREGEALAQLRHPGIASIYATGHTSRGEPLLAMELVDGVPLHQAAGPLPPDGASRRREFERRLNLFLHVCDAVRYAHQRGIIHRDLKPSNILVAAGSGDTSTGTGSSTASPVKVLDFGLALMAETDTTVTRTALGTVQGTLAYMSPEQARGERGLDVRTDVYSLGVILYELLAGRRPYTLDARSLPASIRIINETPPERPGEIDRLLQGDLEVILSTALAKDPDERYESVAAFAEDVFRYLSDQPIAARPPSTIYQLRKLYARHRVPVVLSSALALVLVASVVSLALLAASERRTRHRAEVETAKAEEINTFLRDMLVSVTPDEARGRDVSVRDVLDASSLEVENRLSSQPEVLADLERTIGNTYRSLGEVSRAELHLEKALRVERASQSGRTPTIGLVECLRDLGWVRAHGGRVDSADSLAQEAKECAVAGNYEALLGGIVGLRAFIAQRRGRFAEADKLYRESLSIRETNDESYVHVSGAMNNLADFLRGAGSHAEAESLLRRSLSLRREFEGEDSPAVAVSLNNLGILLTEMGKYEEAEPVFAECLAIRRKVLGDEHPATATVLNNWAINLQHLGKLAEAETIFRQALTSRRSLFGDEHPQVAVSVQNLGFVLYGQRRYEEAAPYFEESVRLQKAAHEEPHPDVAAAINALGQVRKQQERFSEAEGLLREALDIRLVTLGPRHADVAGSLTNLGTLFRVQGRYDEAESLLTRAVETYEGAVSPSHSELASATSSLAVVLKRKGDYARSERLYRKAIASQRATLGSTHASTLITSYNLARVLEPLERYAEAESIYCFLLDVADSSKTADSFVARYLHGAGRTCRLQGKITAAESYLRRCLKKRQVLYAESPDRLTPTLRELGLTLLAEGRFDEADSILARGVAVRSLSGEGDWQLAATRSALWACRHASGSGAGDLAVLVACFRTVAGSEAPVDEKRECRERVVAAYESLNQTDTANRFRREPLD